MEPLGPSDLDYAIIKLFMIDLYHMVETKATLAKNFHIQPSEVDNMVFWEYEIFMQALNNQVQEENDRQEEEMKKYDIQGAMSSVKNISKGPDMSKFSSNIPSFGSIKAPSMKF
jgi:hypothetical protein